jgi:uncharacterized delta-60 repeat protein
VGGNYARIESIAAQSDGRIVVFGSGWLARYLADGSPDPGFGSGGYVQIPAGFTAVAAAAQPDGKIVVAGGYVPASDAAGGFMLARYNADGSLDASFGANGITTTTIGDPPSPGVVVYAGASNLAILPGGKILVAGSKGSEDLISGDPISSAFVLARYTSGGSLDPTFGNGGIVNDGGETFNGGIAVFPSGEIVAAGSYCYCAHDTYQSGMTGATFASDGSPDVGFGLQTSTRFNSYYDGGVPVIQRGKLVVVGSTTARFKRNGQLDRTFGTRGLEKIHVPGLSFAAAVAQPDRRILIGGGHVVVRLLPNGKLDKSFGKNGVVTLHSVVWSLALQADKKILVGGGNGSSWTLTRLLGDPSK